MTKNCREEMYDMQSLKEMWAEETTYHRKWGDGLKNILGINKLETGRELPIS